MRFGRALIAAACLGGILFGCDGPPPAVAEKLGAAGHAAEVTALAYTPDGATLASRGADAIKLWDVATLRERASLPSDGSAFGSFAIRPDGTALAAPLAGRGVVAWDLATRAERAIDGPPPADKAAAAAPTGSFGSGVAFSPDGSKLAGPAPDPAAPASILLHDLSTGAAAGVGPPGSPATHLAFTADGRSLLAKGIEGQIRAYDVAARAEGRAIAANLSYLAGLAVSPDGATVASSGADRYLRLWSVADGAERAKLKGHLKAILGVAFHPDGRHVATGDAGGTVFLWDVPSRRAVAQFPGHAGKVWAIAFRPDGREMATAGEDRRIRLWDVAAAIAAGP